MLGIEIPVNKLFGFNRRNRKMIGYKFNHTLLHESTIVQIFPPSNNTTATTWTPGDNVEFGEVEFLEVIE